MQIPKRKLNDNKSGEDKCILAKRLMKENKTDNKPLKGLKKIKTNDPNKLLRNCMDVKSQVKDLNPLKKSKKLEHSSSESSSDDENISNPMNISDAELYVAFYFLYFI